ncbi:MAG: CBS domain-containing protein, partial [Pleurocapsa sp. SU_196_0]|nr:CBS domain-containing protein [Pleurocapsa sp. SU_196_0]
LEVARTAMTGSSAWVVDENGVLHGWLTRADRGVSVRDAATLQPWQSISISQSASVKEALSRMVSLGFKELSVTDDAGRLQGVLTLEAAMDGRA